VSRLFCDGITKSLEIPKGGVLLISSDIVNLAFQASLSGETFSCDALIESFKAALGPEGTLLFPTFNYDFCEGKTFDIRKTPSRTGALSKAALLRPDFQRTRHPIYSFAVWGKHQKYLCGLNNQSSFGEDSPFAFLYHENALMLLIGLSYQGAFTFVHYAEETERVSYRYFKEFRAPYIDEEGHSEIRGYTMFVRDLEKGVVSSVDPIGETLETKKIAVLKKIHGVDFRMIRLKNAYEEIVGDIRQNSGRKLYTTESTLPKA